MKKNRYLLLLAVIFLLVLGIRLYFAFQQQYFSEDDAYFTLRQVEHIKETGFPAYEDRLSYGGRYYLFLPLFHYILAFFSFFMPAVYACKIFPNIFASLLVFPVFFFVREMTKKSEIGIFAAFVASMIPLYISETINSISVHSLTIPISVLLIHLFFKINTKNNTLFFVMLFFVFLLLDTSIFLILLSMLLYMVFNWTEGLKIKRSEIELVIFSITITVFFYIVFFREAFLLHGPAIIYGNIPSQILNQYYSSLNILEALISIGFIPLVSAVTVIFMYFSKRKKKTVYLPMSFWIAVVTMLIIKLIPVMLGLVYLGIISAILFGELINIILDYFQKTRLFRYRAIFYAAFIILFFLTAILPSLGLSEQKLIESTDEDMVDAAIFLGMSAAEDEVIAATPQDGHLIAYFSGRKTIIDTNYLFVPDIEERYLDLQIIYSSAVSIRAIEIMEKYGAEYILLNDRARKLYNITRISYASEECFPIIFSKNGIQVYEKRCSLD